MSAVAVALITVGAAGALAKAAGLTTRYGAEMQRLRGEWKSAQQAEGLDPIRGAKALYGKYPTPEIALCKPVVIAPGASAPVSLAGRFPERTTFLVDHDQVTLAPGPATAAKYGATATVAVDALPGFARLFAYAPVSGAWNRCGVVVIGAAPSFSLTASNGWTIALAPAAKSWTVNGSSASLGYRAEFFKPGETTPFETMTGSLAVSADEQPDTQYTFSMQPGNTGSAMEEYQALTARMSDPQAFMKMTPKEQAAFQKKLEEVGDRMATEMEAMTANPAAMLEKQAQFGCGSISLTVDGIQARGGVGCGQKVGHLTLTGARR
jgi:hypothetical protein